MLALAAGALLIGAQYYAADQADKAASEREATVVANGVANRVHEISRKAIPQTTWDEAVLNLDRRFSAAWAENNIGTYFSDTDGFESAFVLDRQDRVEYAMRDGQTVAATAVAELVTAAAPLVAAVRQSEAAASPLRARIERGDTMSSHIISSAISRVGGKTYIVTATLVQPDFGDVMPRTDRSPIVVTCEEVDRTFVQTLGERYLLTDVQLERGNERLPAARARAPFVDRQGRVVAALTWSPPKAGAALLSKTLPPMLALLSALTVLAGALFLQGRKATRSLVASEARASHLAYHDALTGLPNRTLLAARLAHNLQTLRRAERPFALLCIDLDRFKEVNDSYGHSAGDELIQIAAQLLANQCRPTDMLARLGGDEFAVVLDDTGPAGAAALADRVVRMLAEPIQLQVGRVFIGASIGVTLVENAGDEPQECLRRADLALYRAKDAGRGQFTFFEPEMDAAIRTRRELQADLRDALTNGDLQLHYQPQVNGRGQIFGLEALARWNHCDRGAVCPSSFVSVAEESGLIEALGTFALRRAFEDSARWPNLKVAINVSAAQLRLRDFVSSVSSLVEEAEVSPSQFELEITEGLLLGDDPHVHATLRRLRDMGFGIALDDFGTGYSSLSYLQRYPID